MNPTLPGSHSKLPLSNYKRPYIVAFQNTQKILRENIRFTRNSESKREFFTKHFEVNNFLIKAFSGLDLGVLRLLITSLFDCEKNDWGEWSKSSQGAFVLEVKVLALLASFSLFNSIFLLFICIVFRGLFRLPSHVWSVGGMTLLGLGSFWGVAFETQHWATWSNG